MTVEKQRIKQAARRVVAGIREPLEPKRELARGVVTAITTDAAGVPVRAQVRLDNSTATVDMNPLGWSNLGVGAEVQAETVGPTTSPDYRIVKILRRGHGTMSTDPLSLISTPDFDTVTAEIYVAPDRTARARVTFVIEQVPEQYAHRQTVRYEVEIRDATGAVAGTHITQSAEMIAGRLYAGITAVDTVVPLILYPVDAGMGLLPIPDDNFPRAGIIQIDDELIGYDAIARDTITGYNEIEGGDYERAYDGTVAAAHDAAGIVIARSMLLVVDSFAIQQNYEARVRAIGADGRRSNPSDWWAFTTPGEDGEELLQNPSFDEAPSIPPELGGGVDEEYGWVLDNDSGSTPIRDRITYAKLHGTHALQLEITGPSAGQLRANLLANVTAGDILRLRMAFGFEPTGLGTFVLGLRFYEGVGTGYEPRVVQVNVPVVAGWRVHELVAETPPRATTAEAFITYACTGGQAALLFLDAGSLRIIGTSDHTALESTADRKVFIGEIEFDDGTKLTSAGLGGADLSGFLPKSGDEQMEGALGFDLTPGGPGFILQQQTWTVDVPAATGYSGIDWSFHNTHTATDGSQLYGIILYTEGDAIDTGAALAIVNTGRADGLYISMRGKAGAVSDNQPSGIGLDINRAAGGGENSSTNRGIAVNIFDWSTTDQGVDGPIMYNGQKIGNPNSNHVIFRPVGNRHHIRSIVLHGVGYDGNQPLYSINRDDTGAMEWMISADGNEYFKTEGHGVYFFVGDSEEARIVGQDSNLDFFGGGGGWRFIDKDNLREALRITEAGSVAAYASLIAPQVIVDNQAADGGALTMRSAGYDSWDIDAYNGVLRYVQSGIIALSLRTDGSEGRIELGGPLVFPDGTIQRTAAREGYADAAEIASLMLMTPGIRGYWSGTSWDENRNLMDLSGQERHLLPVGGTLNLSMVGEIAFANVLLSNGLFRPNEAGMYSSKGLTVGTLVYVADIKSRDQIVIEKTESYELVILMDGQVRFSTIHASETRTVTTEARVAEGAWVFIGGRYDGAIVSAWVADEITKVDYVSLNTIKTSTYDLQVGRSQSNPSSKFVGRIAQTFLAAAAVPDSFLEALNIRLSRLAASGYSGEEVELI